MAPSWPADPSEVNDLLTSPSRSVIAACGGQCVESVDDFSTRSFGGRVNPMANCSKDCAAQHGNHRPLTFTRSDFRRHDTSTIDSELNLGKSATAVSEESGAS